MNQTFNESGKVTLRPAVETDVGLILKFILELAEYEHLEHQVDATEKILSEQLFKKHRAEAIIAELNGEPVGYALYFYNFSTFTGRAGIYLEDLYVRPHARRHGVGRALFIRLAQLCEEEGCPRLEWSCLDWNTPSIAFYKGLGAAAQSDWTGYRLTKESIRRLAESGLVQE